MLKQVLIACGCLLVTVLAGEGETYYEESHHQQEPAEHHIQEHHVEVHAPQPYEFGYKIHDGKGNTQHREENGNGHGGVTGSYGYTDKLGVYRKVIYVADKFGFRANIHTNEPGTANQDPADVNVKAETPPFYVYYKPVESYKHIPVHQEVHHGHESQGHQEVHHGHESQGHQVEQYEEEPSHHK